RHHRHGRLVRCSDRRQRATPQHLTVGHQPNQALDRHVAGDALARRRPLPELVRHGPHYPLDRQVDRSLTMADIGSLSTEYVTATVTGTADIGGSPIHVALPDKNTEPTTWYVAEVVSVENAAGKWT